ncbi:6-hydroxymethylpterin diphosphokinase MptE-like protein [Neobacillus rhizosphaerae]|uniref:6-hydroxymethylpterin diphosphokinase MptE-like protein n=1 Tax=Neobacillus rhizosphaerae TaxID=2880965 RepID=UPI003D2B8D73
MKNMIKKITNNVASFIIWTYRRKIRRSFINIRIRMLSQRVKKYKDIHIGESCFIIGNGPSLTGEDLNKIKNQISFSSNRINLFLDDTKWSPYYYTFIDARMAVNFFDEVYNMRKKQMFVVVTDAGYSPLKKHFGKECVFLRSYHEHEKSGLPKFSEDLSEKLNTHGTVTYANIQLAIYMGFKNIYLIGVDNNYAINKQEDGSIEINKELIGKDYFKESYYNSIENAKQVPNNIYAMSQAYKSAKQYCDQRGVKIYNATRGGKLEVFPRVNFDDLFDTNGNFIGETVAGELGAVKQQGYKTV